ncbi:MAG: S46 family peptidase [Bacteroidales bacterium]|nr:S46 family peptidase [Bacteroidales bacterium]
MKKINFIFLLLFSFSILNISAQRTIYKPLDLSKVEFSFDDFGSMWTFDAVPLDKYQQKYGFTPDKTWLEHVQKSALQFGRGCSGAFVSEDGLIMTNHHCVRGRLKDIEKEDESLMRNGFYAKSLDEERKIPGMFVDQLISITDVTQAVLKAMAKGKTGEEKIELKNNEIDKLIKKYEKKTGLVCKVVTLYNGGKYSLYAYKRYNDIRLVMVPDFQIAATGWDWDNFTYPRYELDFAFCRAYDETGKPVKVENYFTWSKKGAQAGEAIFVIGRPGNTDRLLSVNELKYYRDVLYPPILTMLNDRYHKAFKDYEQAAPEDKERKLSTMLGVANGRKYYAGLLMALNDKYIMAKKEDFEKKLKAKVAADPVLKAEYGTLWDNIDKIIAQMKEHPDKRNDLKASLDVLNQKLGRLIFDAYGSQIPPDATITLRISDGTIKAYEYNGTIAPGKTTYYGLWDRYYSFGQKDYPWGLHPRWQKVPEGLDLSIPVGFASTNDIVGGNSGSSVINTKGEVVGLIHDGNLESLAGAYIFLEENNRAVATDSWGLMEALKLVYKTNRLVRELENSKLTE